MTFMGYSVENWRWAYCLWISEYKEPPKSLFELKEHWESARPLTPKDTVKIGLQLVNVSNKHWEDSRAVIDMIKRVSEYMKNEE